MGSGEWRVGQLLVEMQVFPQHVLVPLQTLWGLPSRSLVVLLAGLELDGKPALPSTPYLCQVRSPLEGPVPTLMSTLPPRPPLLS